MASAPPVDLARRPLVTIYGELYRMPKARAHCGRCDQTIRCQQCHEDGVPLPCEGVIEPELTGVWPKAAKGERLL